MPSASWVAQIARVWSRVNKVYPDVDPGTHAALVLDDVRNQVH